MKECTVCGSPNEDGSLTCSVCGSDFSSALPEVLPVDPKAERKAIAGFVLSMMGFASVITTPLQLVALLLCLSAKSARRCKALRLVGVIASAAALVISVILWVLFGIYSDTILELMFSEMYY